jgi:hypothetical protein
VRAAVKLRRQAISQTHALTDITATSVYEPPSMQALRLPPRPPAAADPSAAQEVAAADAAASTLASSCAARRRAADRRSDVEPDDTDRAAMPVGSEPNAEADGEATAAEARRAVAACPTGSPAAGPRSGGGSPERVSAGAGKDNAADPGPASMRSAVAGVTADATARLSRAPQAGEVDVAVQWHESGAVELVLLPLPPEATLRAAPPPRPGPAMPPNREASVCGLGDDAALADDGLCKAQGPAVLSWDLLWPAAPPERHERRGHAPRTVSPGRSMEADCSETPPGAPTVHTAEHQAGAAGRGASKAASEVDCDSVLPSPAASMASEADPDWML